VGGNDRRFVVIFGLDILLMGRRPRVVTVVASLAKIRRNPEVYATHGLTEHHHPPPGAELEHLREVSRHPEREPVAGQQTLEQPDHRPTDDEDLQDIGLCSVRIGGAS
jgi:hypothetical protein